MAVPFINFLAPSMGGIGPIELSDFTRLQLLKEKSGVPFYAGRFYPKNNKGIIEDLLDGLWQSNTPPWLTWEEIEPTQIWMVPAFEDERIVTTQTSIERIDVWPRLPDDDLPEWENTMRDDIAQERGWGKISLPGIAGNGQSIEPGITIANNFIPPPLFAGYLGISQISGYVSEYAFYDQELHIMNSKRFGQPQYEQIALSYDRDPETYLELIRIREDGAWINRNAELPTGDFSMDEDNEDGYPIDSNWSNNEYPSTDYAAWVTSPDTLEASTINNSYWDFFTKFSSPDVGISVPRAGVVRGIKPTKLDTVVFTIKVSCTTIVVPDDPVPESIKETLDSYKDEALETFGSNLSNNVWYFYMPVRWNGDLLGKRSDFIINRAGINRLNDPQYFAP